MTHSGQSAAEGATETLKDAIELLKGAAAGPRCKVCKKPLEIQNSTRWGLACPDHWDETRMDFGSPEYATKWAYQMAIFDATKILEALETTEAKRDARLADFDKALQAAKGKHLRIGQAIFAAICTDLKFDRTDDHNSGDAKVAHRLFFIQDHELLALVQKLADATADAEKRTS